MDLTSPRSRLRWTTSCFRAGYESGTSSDIRSSSLISSSLLSSLRPIVTHECFALRIALNLLSITAGRPSTTFIYTLLWPRRQSHTKLGREQHLMGMTQSRSSAGIYALRNCNQRLITRNEKPGFPVLISLYRRSPAPAPRSRAESRP